MATRNARTARTTGNTAAANTVQEDTVTNTAANTAPAAANTVQEDTVTNTAAPAAPAAAITLEDVKTAMAAALTADMDTTAYSDAIAVLALAGVPAPARTAAAAPKARKLSAKAMAEGATPEKHTIDASTVAQGIIATPARLGSEGVRYAPRHVVHVAFTLSEAVNGWTAVDVAYDAKNGRGQLWADGQPQHVVDGVYGVADVLRSLGITVAPLV